MAWALLTGQHRCSQLAQRRLINPKMAACPPEPPRRSSGPGLQARRGPRPRGGLGRGPAGACQWLGPFQSRRDMRARRGGSESETPSTARSVATIALIQVGLLRRTAGPAVFRCPSRDAARSAWWPETRREQVAARYRRGNFVEAAESELPRSSLADSGPTNVRCCCWRQATDSPAKVAACAVVRSVQVEPAQDLAGLAGVVGVPRDQVRNIRVLDRPAQLRALGLSAHAMLRLTHSHGVGHRGYRGRLAARSKLCAHPNAKRCKSEAGGSGSGSVGV
jgi:hypothetical protein